MLRGSRLGGNAVSLAASQVSCPGLVSCVFLRELTERVVDLSVAGSRLQMLLKFKTKGLD